LLITSLANIHFYIPFVGAPMVPMLTKTTKIGIQRKQINLQ